MSLDVDSIIQVQLQFAFNGAYRAMNVWHGKVTDFDAGLTNQEFADAITDDLAAFHNLWLATYTDALVRGTVAVWSEWDDTNQVWQVIAESDFNVTGVSLGDMLPPGVAAMVKLPCLAGGRQGRKFVYGLTEGSQEDGVLGLIPQAALAGWGSDMANERGDSGAKVQFGRWSRATATFSPFIGVANVDAVIAYQRRRKQNVGW